MTPKQRADLFIQIGATIAAILVAGALRRFVEPRWELLLVVATVFVATTLVKWRRPTHWILGGASWAYFLISWFIVAAIVLVLTDVRLLGFWLTVPAAIGLGLLYCVVHVVLVDGGWRKRR